MSTTITMSLSSDSIGKAIKELKKYRKSIDTKAAKLQQIIADRIKNNASDSFKNAFELYTDLSGGKQGDLDVTVTVEPNGDVLTVVARGSDAIWAEFGTGVHFNGSAGSSPHPKGAENGFLIGMYGKGHGSRDKWAFTGPNGRVWTHGIEASQAMYKACEDIYNEYVSIVRGVFK